MKVIIASNDTYTTKAISMADFFDHEALREYILALMQKQNMSQHEVAAFIGVSQPTIQRAITFGGKPPSVPDLEFLIKLAQSTRVDITSLIAAFVPSARGTDGRTLLLMNQIAGLPERERDVADLLLRGLLLVAGDRS